MNNSFSAGVKPGGLTEEKEVRILICQMLSFVKEGMSFEEMADVFLPEGMMNYFVFTGALTYLVKHGCVTQKKNDKGISIYEISSKGVEISESFKGKLPKTVAEKAKSRAAEKIKMRRTEAENSISITKTCDGYNIKLLLKDIGTNLLDLSLFLPSQEEAEKVKKAFLKDPEGTYLRILSDLVKF